MLPWAIFAVLTAVVLYALLRPLAGGSGGEGSRAAFNATVYRDQLGEVQSDRERGLIGEGDAEAARIEIARRLLAADAETPAEQGSAAHSPLRVLGIALAVGLPLAALSLYLSTAPHAFPTNPSLPASRIRRATRISKCWWRGSKRGSASIQRKAKGGR